MAQREELWAPVIFGVLMCTLAAVPLLGAGTAAAGERCRPASPPRPGACARVTIDVDYPSDRKPSDIAALLVRLSYPADRLVMPGNAGGPEIRQRVQNLTAISDGIFGAADNDRAVPANVSASQITLAPAGIARGRFVAIHFDCVDGAPPASAEFFANGCTAEASDRSGSPVEASCRVSSFETTS